MMGEVLAVTCAVVWAAAVVLFRKAGRTESPVALNAFKNTVALALCLGTLPVLGIPWLPREGAAADYARLLISGALGIGISDSLYFAALNRLGAGRVAIVSCLYSPCVVLASVLVLQEPVGAALIAAVGLVVAGILIGSAASATGEEGGRPERGAGVLLGIAAVVLVALAIVIAKPALAGCDPWWAATVRLVGGMVILVPQGAREPYRSQIRRCFRPGPSWRASLPAVVLGGYVSMILWIAGFKYTYASTASILNQTSTFFIMAFGALFLGEVVTGRKVAAMLLGFTGAVVAALGALP